MALNRPNTAAMEFPTYPDIRLLARYTRGLAPKMAMIVPTPTSNAPTPINASITMRSTISVPSSRTPTPNRLSSTRTISASFSAVPDVIDDSDSRSESKWILSARNNRTFRQLSAKSRMAKNIMHNAIGPPMAIKIIAWRGTGI